jgi:hypothetical protein
MVGSKAISKGIRHTDRSNGAVCGLIVILNMSSKVVWPAHDEGPLQTDELLPAAGTVFMLAYLSCRQLVIQK